MYNAMEWNNVQMPSIRFYFQWASTEP